MALLVGFMLGLPVVAAAGVKGGTAGVLEVVVVVESFTCARHGDTADNTIGMIALTIRRLVLFGLFIAEVHPSG